MMELSWIDLAWVFTCLGLSIGACYFCYKILKNIKKDEKYALINIYNREFGRLAFKILAVAGFIFGVGMVLGAIEHIRPTPPLNWIRAISPLVLYVGLFLFTYLLSKATK